MKEGFEIRNVIVTHPTVMEGIPPQNVSVRIIFETSPLRTIKIFLRKNENKLKSNETGYAKQKLNISNYEFIQTKVTDSFKCQIQSINRDNKTLIGRTLLLIVLYFDNISMLKRSYSMEFEPDQYKSELTQIANSEAGKDTEENVQITKKICNSSFEEGKSPTEPDASPENNRGSSHGRAEPYRRYSQSGENAHVTQSRSIFSHEDGFVYGNPKEDIKSIENPPAGESVGATTPFENNSTSALDLSCKGPKAEEEKTPSDGNTYQNYQRTDSFPRSNLEIKLVNPPCKKPSLPEQLQIAKIQQQQRRSMQHQQKLVQQMRRSLDPKSSNRQETFQSSHKNVKYYGNSTTNHEQNDLDNHARMKDEFHPPIPGAHFPQFPYPYFDPTHPKELPDNHPILPLLDPVYFSALYNAHGFLPPSSPSIAAAFIGTLQDALPKLPMMFPSTSSNNSPLLPQKGNENPN